jgi:hypothetical protein
MKNQTKVTMEKRLRESRSTATTTENARYYGEIKL